MVRPRLVCLGLALLTLWLYLPVRRHEFLVYDDPDYVTQNRVVLAGLTMAGAQWAFTGFHASNWHPLTWLSHMFDCEWFGPDPGAQHLVNVLFHAANAILLFLLLFRLTDALWPATVVAALFAWHPLHVESVAWISERKDVLSAFFGLLALMAYARYAVRANGGRQKMEGERLKAEGGRRKAEGRGEPANRIPLTSGLRPPTAGSYWLALLCFALGLLSKPMLVTLPFLMLLLDYWPLRRVSGPDPLVSNSAARDLEPEIRKVIRLALEKWPFFVLTLTACALAYVAQRPEAVLTFEQRSLSARLANAPVACVGYLGKMIWPADLAIFYPLPKQLPRLEVFLGVVILLGITFGVWWLRRRSPYALAGWLWFLGMLVPVIGLVQVGGQAMADRYTYLPLVGVFMLMAYGGSDLAKRVHRGPLICGTAAMLALAACLILTTRQLRYWRDSESLFARAVAVTKDNDTAQINLGVALEQAGKPDEAFAHYAEALRINPDSAQAHSNLANLLANAGKRQEALTHYREAMRLKPKSPRVRENFGTLLVDLRRFEEALQQYAEAARLAPDDPRPFYLMGKARLRQGQSAEAITRFREALRRDPNDVPSLTYLARVLAADEDPRLRNGPEAVGVAVRANELTGGDQPFLLDTLAMAYAEMGRFDEAQPAIRKAIDLAEAAGIRQAVTDMRSRLRLYQAGRPYRESFTNASNASAE